MAKQDSETEKGTQEEATSQSSDNSVGQRGSATEVDVVAKLNELQKKLDTVTRSLQSDKDRAVKGLNQRVDSLEGDIRTVLQQAQRDGKNVTDILGEIEAAEEMETRTLMREFLKSQSGQRVDRQSAQRGVDVSAIVSELELDQNDLRVKAFQAQEFQSEAEAYREGAKLLKSISKTQPSDADKESTVAQNRASASTQEKLMQEYREGSKNKFGRDLINFKMEMRKKGLDIS